HDARERHPPGRVRRQARRAGPLAGTGVVLRSGVRALDREAARDGRELHGDAPPPRELHGGRHVGADRRGAALDLRASRPGLAGGWPGVNPGFEPVPIPVAVGDLDHDGHLWIVAATSTGKLHVWDAHGTRRPGWPEEPAEGVVPLESPRTPLEYSRVPHEGIF